MTDWRDDYPLNCRVKLWLNRESGEWRPATVIGRDGAALVVHVDSCPFTEFAISHPGAIEALE